MRKIVVFIAASLDGYIATPEDQMDWLYAVKGEGDNGYSAFYQGIDTVVMGRRTYDWICENSDAFLYPDADSYIVSGNPHLILENVTQIFPDKLSEKMKELKRQEGKDIWIVGGGQLITALLEAGFIDELCMTIAPLLLGKGIALFHELSHSIQWHFEGATTYGQFVELHYTRQNKE